ncbi:MAG TPA: hypothetical protein VFJ51_05055 [Nitrososphaeraceae archaeon]|nr:hypothetical protein [Nitrososphaeraceae archaeon]
MTPTEFEQFLKFAEDQLSNKTDSQKIQAFTSWCKKNDTEEVILRLSSEDKGGWGRNFFFLDFTTSRIIVSKKRFLRKFLDLGYVAGMAPFPYMIFSKKLKPSNIRKQALINPSNILDNNSSNFFISYSDIQEIVIRKGTENIVRNMLGTMITSNFLTVKTASKTYNYVLPANKNGTFEEIYYWLSIVLPVKVSANYN